MGLDIYFYKRSKNEENDFSQEKIDKIEEVIELLDEEMEKLSERTNKMNATLPKDEQLDVTKNSWWLELERTKGTLLDLQDSYNQDTTDDNDEVAYFRKVNFLMRFFDYTGNCEYKEIDKEDIERLVDACKRVLLDDEEPSEVLPNTDGFFFGGMEYDDYYLKDVKDVYKKFKKILEETDFDNERIEMYAWW